MRHVPLVWLSLVVVSLSTQWFAVLVAVGSCKLKLANDPTISLAVSGSPPAPRVSTAPEPSRIRSRWHGPCMLA
jgi:hypothetical protein